VRRVFEAACAVECGGQCLAHLDQLFNERRAEQHGAMAVGFKIDPNVEGMGLWVQVFHTCSASGGTYTSSIILVIHAYAQAQFKG